jgi:light-regulated signal transduction histidine kinase (bacteriophytochrome)
LILPDSALEAALAKVPIGNDRNLIRSAVRQGLHVFLTCDKGIQKAKSALSPFGLLIASPQELLGELFATGAFLCMLEERFLYWPMPDQQRVAHLFRSLGEPTEAAPWGVVYEIDELIAHPPQLAISAAHKARFADGSGAP